MAYVDPFERKARDYMAAVKSARGLCGCYGCHADPTAPDAPAKPGSCVANTVLEHLLKGVKPMRLEGEG